MDGPHLSSRHWAWAFRATTGRPHRVHPASLLLGACCPASCMHDGGSTTVPAPLPRPRWQPQEHPCHKCSVPANHMPGVQTIRNNAITRPPIKELARCASNTCWHAFSPKKRKPLQADIPGFVGHTMVPCKCPGSVHAVTFNDSHATPPLASPAPWLVPQSSPQKTAHQKRLEGFNNAQQQPVQSRSRQVCASVRMYMGRYRARP